MKGESLSLSLALGLWSSAHGKVAAINLMPDCHVAATSEASLGFLLPLTMPATSHSDVCLSGYIYASILCRDAILRRRTWVTIFTDTYNSFRFCDTGLYLGAGIPRELERICSPFPGMATGKHIFVNTIACFQEHRLQCKRNKVSICAENKHLLTLGISTAGLPSGSGHDLAHFVFPVLRCFQTAPAEVMMYPQIRDLEYVTLLVQLPVLLGR